MKKTFKLTHPKIKFARLVDGVRSDVKKYLARERKKELPEGFDVWDFDCRVGLTAEAAKVVPVPELGKAIDARRSSRNPYISKFWPGPATGRKIQTRRATINPASLYDHQTENRHGVKS